MGPHKRRGQEEGGRVIRDMWHGIVFNEPTPPKNVQAFHCRLPARISVSTFFCAMPRTLPPFVILPPARPASADDTVHRTRCTCHMVRDSRTARGGRQWPWALVSEEKTEGGCRGSMRDERHRQAAAAERRRRVAAMPASACRSVGSGQMESSVSSGSRRCRGVSPAAKAAAGSTTARVRGAGSCCGPAGGRWRTQQRRATALRTLFAIGVGLVMHARGATGYLIKAHMHWERVGAFPHYLTTPPEEKDASKEWPRSTLCYNGPSCAKHMPDYACNSDCGNPNIGIKDDTGQNYPKDDMIRFVRLPNPAVPRAPCVSLLSLSFLDCASARW